MQTILTIDDDPITLKLLNEQLTSHNFKVLSASSGTQGIEMAKTAQPDLILLDIQMPEMDGIIVLKKLNDMPITTNIPIIMLTGIKDKTVVINTMKKGIIDYIIKPYNVNDLINKINAGLRYSKIKKSEQVSDESDNILISHDKDTIVISFKVPLSNKVLLTEARKVFTPFFLRQSKNKYLIFDLRTLPSFESHDAEILTVLVKLFKSEKLLLVAGRHYGSIVAHTDIDEETTIFISYGDLSLYLKGKI